MWKACYNNLTGDLKRKPRMAQLHVYADGADTVPSEIMSCKSGWHKRNTKDITYMLILNRRKCSSAAKEGPRGPGAGGGAV
jgi:hypothetical protein